jgi:hypothetical protein
MDALGYNQPQFNVYIFRKLSTPSPSKHPEYEIIIIAQTDGDTIKTLH